MIVAPARRRSYQYERSHIARVLGRIKQRQQPTPRVAQEEETVDFPLFPQRFQVGYVIPPPNFMRFRHLRSAAAALVIEVEAELVGETTKGREQVVVLSTRTAVEHGYRWPNTDLSYEQSATRSHLRIFPKVEFGSDTL
ncbi:MAG: hypothetical protein AMS21_06845 [Gemmatimonas sp. SG8_38_2]|nr:MAG: hypothetical protein AMS21_06845 [Gemmatimonas sp. SG8_38_2]